MTVGNLDHYIMSGLHLNLKDVYRVPSVYGNIISVSCLDTERLLFETKNSCVVIMKDGMFNDKHSINLNVTNR